MENTTWRENSPTFSRINIGTPSLRQLDYRNISIKSYNNANEVLAANCDEKIFILIHNQLHPQATHFRNPVDSSHVRDYFEKHTSFKL